MDKFNLGVISRALKQVQMDEGLTFEDKQLSWDSADDVKDVVSLISSARVLHFLKLEGNTLGVEAAEAIGDALKGHPEFRKALWRNLFTRRLKNEIPLALRHLGNSLIVAQAQLVELDLSDNALGSNGMVGIEALLCSSVCYTLQILRLNNCGLGIGGGRMLSNALIECFQNSVNAGRPMQLKVFEAGRNRLENDGSKALATVFGRLRTFEEISLPQNSIYYVGIEVLAEAIAKNPNLRVLNLNDNTITHKGAAALSEALVFVPKLKEADFGDCLLKTNGAFNLAAAFELGHKDLEVLDMSFNEIGPDGGLILAQIVRNKPQLCLLNLDGNQFGSEGRMLIKKEMAGAINPEALGDMDEDQSDCEDDSEDNPEELVDFNKKYDYQSDTTEEYDEDVLKDAIEETTDSSYETHLTGANSQSSSAGMSLALKKITEPATSSNITMPITAKTFCLSQEPLTLEMFESLQESNKLTAFKGIIKQFDGDKRLFILIFTTLKCAHLCQASEEALDIAISLYKECIDYAVDIKQERRVINFILIQLCLLRSEEKFKTRYNVKSCRLALRKTLENHNISSEYMRDVFTVFLSAV